MQTSINKREFLSTAGSFALGLLASLPARAASTDPLLGDQLEKYLNFMNQQLGLIPDANAATGISLVESNQRQEQFYQVVANFYNEHEKQGFDFSDPKKIASEAVRYLLTKGMYLSVEVLERDDGKLTKHLPVMRLFKVDEGPLETFGLQKKDYPQLKIFRVSGEMGTPVSTDFFPYFSGTTRIFPNSEASIVLNAAAMKGVTRDNRAKGVDAKDEPYLRSVLITEVAYYDFMQKYKDRPALKAEIEITFPGGEKISTDLKRLGKAKADCASFSVEGAFASNVLRILNSALPQDQESRMMLAAAMTAYERTSKEVIDPSGMTLTLAQKLSKDSELNRRVCAYVQGFYKSFFEKIIFPVLDR